MTLVELRARWEQRADEFRRFGALVSGEAIVRDLLADLDALERERQLGSVTLKEAHLVGGYSTDHLQRLVATGELETSAGSIGLDRITTGLPASKTDEPAHGTGTEGR